MVACRQCRHSDKGHGKAKCGGVVRRRGWGRGDGGKCQGSLRQPVYHKSSRPGRAVSSRQSTDLTSFVIASQRVGAKRRPMTGSAKQSITASQAEEWIASSLSLLAMTSD